MTEEKKENIKTEGASTFVEYEGVPEIIPAVKPLYYDAVKSSNPWPIQDDTLLRKFSLNDNFVDEKTGKLDHNKIKQDYLEYHQWFKKQWMIVKIGLILWSLPKHIYYNYLAPSNDSQFYKSVKWFLDSSRKNQDNFLKND